MERTRLWCRSALPVPKVKATTLKAMKLTAIFLTVICLQVSAGSLAQVTFSGKEVALEKVFDAIKRQTDFTVFYDTYDLRDARKVTVTVKDVSVQTILDKCLADQPLEYKISGNSIFISRKKEEKGNINIGNVFADAQPPTRITGKVINQNNDPVQGATVSEKGTKNATSTLNDGTFVIMVENPNGILVITGANIESLEYRYKFGQATIIASVTMKISKLDEIQVIAYGTNTQRYQVGSVTKVSSEEIEQQPISNPLLSLSGRVPGLTVVQSSGVPGSSVGIRIRGQNSLLPKTGGNVLFDNPLFIINGVPYAPQNNFVNQYTSIFGNGSSASQGSPGYSPFNSINPSDIESIEILRDADATSIYGSRGANGVIIVTTKKGKPGKTGFKANVYSGYSKVTRSMPLMGITQYLEMRHEAFRNDKIVPNTTLWDPGYAPDLLIFDTTKNTDWKKEFIGESSKVVDANISVSGGTENTQFILGAGYRHETFIFPGDFKNDRISVNAGFHHNSRDKAFFLDFSSNYSYDLNNSSGNASLFKAFTLPPNYPDLVDDNNNLVWDYKGVNLEYLVGGNPISYLAQVYRMKNYNFINSLIAGYQIIKGLTFQSNFGYNTFNTNEYRIFPKRGENPINNPLGRANFGTNNYQSWIIEPQVSYSTKILKGKLKVLVGSTFQKTTNSSSDISGTRYTDDRLLGSIVGAGTITAKDASSLYKYNAIFGRINYQWDGKYLISLNGRRDGSSRFGPGKQFGNFGSAGAGWIFSEEKFLKENSFGLSFGKIRATIGTTGNDNIANYQFISTYAPISGVTYQGSVGYVPQNLFNPNFSWAATRKIEFGLELGFLNDRLYLNVAYYRNKTDNQLVSYTLPSQAGFGNVTRNAPYVVTNRGLEIAVSSTNISSKNFSWSTGFNISVPKNRLASFPNLDKSGYKYAYVEGKSLTALQKLIYTGINDTTGLFEFQDLDKDGSVQQLNDYTYIGDLDPKYYGGLSNSISYKGFQFDFYFQYNKQMGANYLGQIYSSMIVGSDFNLPTSFLDRWQKAGDESKIQRFTTSYGQAYNAGVKFSQSNAAYSDASFIRLKTISLTYTLPSKWMKSMKMQTCRVFVNAQNLFTITNYEGNDPENQSYFSLPPLKTIVAGININM